jgi:hypothetical protein
MIIEKLFARIPLFLLPFLLPHKFVLYGHLIGDFNHPIRARFRYPTYGEFDLFISFLHKHNYSFVPFNEYFKNDNRKKVLLTLDDGYKEIFDCIQPFLKLRKIPYSIFIMTEPFENPYFLIKTIGNDTLNKSRRFVNEDEIKALKANGVHIGFHTRTHFRIDTELNNSIEKEIYFDKKYAALFSQPLAFSYPWSAPIDYSTVDMCIEGKGYKYIFDTKGYFASVNNHIFRIPMDIDNNINCNNCLLYNIKRYAGLNLLWQLLGHKG